MCSQRQFPCMSWISCIPLRERERASEGASEKFYPDDFHTQNKDFTKGITSYSQLWLLQIHSPSEFQFNFFYYAFFAWFLLCECMCAYQIWNSKHSCWSTSSLHRNFRIIFVCHITSTRAREREIAIFRHFPLFINTINFLFSSENHRHFFLSSQSHRASFFLNSCIYCFDLIDSIYSREIQPLVLFSSNRLHSFSSLHV